MFLLVNNVLTQTEIGQIQQLGQGLKFVDGRSTNVHNEAKRNLQLDMTQPNAVKLCQIAAAAVGRNEQIRNFAFPKRIAQPLLSLYEPGMTYGEHADAPYLQLPGGPLRSDVSGTLFLEDPTSYKGGELVIRLGSEKVKVKGEPGAMIIYPSTTIHEVAPVTEGRRLAFFTFIESQIPDEAERELLYLVYEVHALEGFNIKPENRTRLQYIASRLHRMWSR
ncbi:MAG TPA: Fe2+-dependent dioxygenase [Rhizomicrobium sp.]|nr:Fe2+-dependent dioxygenase [Rhizomicrobium sp.]